MPTYTITPVYDGVLIGVDSTLDLVFSGSGTRYLDTSSVVRIGHSPGASAWYYYSTFPLSAIPMDETITSASMRVVIKNTTEPGIFSVYPVYFDYDHSLPISTSTTWYSDSITSTSSNSYSSGTSMFFISGSYAATMIFSANGRNLINSQRKSNSFLKTVLSSNTALVRSGSTTAFQGIFSSNSPNSPSLVIITIAQQPALVVSPL